MLLRSSLVGMIEIDASAGASFGLCTGGANRFSSDSRITDLTGNTVCPAVVADIARLRDELDGELRRLQARLAA